MPKTKKKMAKRRFCFWPDALRWLDKEAGKRRISSGEFLRRIVDEKRLPSVLSPNALQELAAKR